MANGQISIDAECDENESGEDLSDVLEKPEQFAGECSEHPEA